MPLHDHSHERSRTRDSEPVHAGDGHLPDPHGRDGHGHGHGHGRGHGHPSGHGSAFAIAIALNALFVVVEFGFGIAANSTALAADAGHNLSDVFGLVLAWAGTWMARKAPRGRYTYGMRSGSILAALANAMLLLVACGSIAWEAVTRFAAPPPVAGTTVTVVAALGIVVNGVSAWLFARGSQRDLNVRGAFLHLAADAAVSLGVVLAGIAMTLTGALWLDPLVSLLVVAAILAGTWSLLRDSVRLAMSAVPGHIELRDVVEHLRAQPGVADVHDLHVWGMSTTESALTAHLVMPGGHPGDAFIGAVARSLDARFGIAHSTLQVELGPCTHGCALDRES